MKNKLSVKAVGLIVVIALSVSILSSVVVAKANGGSSVLDKVVRLLELAKELDEVPAESDVAGGFISSGTNLTDLTVENDLVVTAALTGGSATSSFSAYVDGVDFYVDNTLVDSTSTISFVCNSDNQTWIVEEVNLIVPASGASGAGAADAFGARVIDFSVSENQFSSSTAPFAVGLSYSTSTDRAGFGWDSATSTLQAVPVAVTNGQCITAYMNKAASSTASSNTDGVFKVKYRKVN